MSYRIHPQQLENVFSLSSKERYEHFIIKVCDWQEVWFLAAPNESFLTIKVDDTNEYVPVWPHKEYALAFAKNTYSSYLPSSMGIDKFVEEFLPKINDSSLNIGTLPNLETTVWSIKPEDLRDELIAELEEHE